MNKNWIWYAAVAGGAYALNLSKNKGIPIQGLGAWISPKVRYEFEKTAARDPWIGHYSQGFTFTPTLSTAYWTIDKAAITPPSSPLARAAQSPIILKAKSVADLEKAVDTLKSNRDRAQRYASMLPPGGGFKRAYDNAVLTRNDQKSNTYVWKVNTEAQRYISIINTALPKAEAALSKAKATEEEARERREAINRLKEVTEEPALPDAPTMPSVPSPEEEAVSKEEQEKEYQSWIERFTNAPLQPLPSPSPAKKPMPQQQAAPAARQPVAPLSAPKTPLEINPLAAGTAVAVVPILAAVL